MTVKNPGLSIVYITRKGTGLSLGQLNAVTHVPEVFAPPWTSTDTFSVLENHESIEPGLTVKEQKLLMLPYQEGDVFFPGIPSCCT